MPPVLEGIGLLSNVPESILGIIDESLVLGIQNQITGLVIVIINSAAVLLFGETVI